MRLLQHKTSLDLDLESQSEVQEVLENVVDTIVQKAENEVHNVLQNVVDDVIDHVENTAAFKITRTFRSRQLSKKLSSVAEKWKTMAYLKDDDGLELTNPEFTTKGRRILKGQAMELLAILPLRSKSQKLRPQLSLDR